jgi:prepilin-type N-terminal cleavage/methylation domain-containing protein
MKTLNRTHHARGTARNGFTLVEMLVAVALVLLMMTMFAEIFTLATGSMGKQKALADLDQRQRLFSTVIRADIQKKSFFSIIAAHPAQFGTTDGEIFGRGYFYISENDPDNDADDVLQFTVTRNSSDGDPFYGRAQELIDKNNQGIGTNPNQPDFDDGMAGNQIGIASSVEVAYFLRNGILYRRALLIRPTPTGAGTLGDAPVAVGPPKVSLIQTGIYPQGTGMMGGIYVSGASVSSRFPVDFDYSATYDYTAGRLEFLGAGSLDNNLGPANSLILGLPSRRFGFQPTPNPALSKPFEVLPSGEFIGRFTQEETSNSQFAFPGDPGTGADGNYGTNDDTNPYASNSQVVYPPAGAPYLITEQGTTQAVGRFASGPRQGEDILLTNVYAFDVKVWDNVMGAFVDIGHTGMATINGVPVAGEYAQVNNHNPNYGPNASNNRCFDTWHPNMDSLPLVGPFNVTNPAPFRPVADRGVDGLPGRGGYDDDQNGVTDDATELGWPGGGDTLSPMKAIQIRIRYRETSTGLTRDVTLIESLVAPGT